MTSLDLKILHVPPLAGKGVGMRGLVWFSLLLWHNCWADVQKSGVSRTLANEHNVST